MVLWIVDTLRADRLGLHGAENPVSPNYDALAERSTVFESAVAQSSWTRPTVATLLTGVGPIKHGVHRAEHSLGGEWRLLPERLGELGYATAGFTANGNVQEKFGFDRLAGADSRPVVSVSLLTGEAVLDLRPQYSLVLDEWKLVWTKPATVELFDRVNDPAELVDLANEEPALTRRLLRILQDEVERAELQAVESDEVALDEEARRLLRAMGYVE